MSAQSMLEQLLKSGMSMIDAQKGGGVSAPSSPSAQAGRSGQSGDAGWGKFGAGAATGDVLGLLLGSKRGRRMGGSALKYGSIAAVGVVAFKAYQAWQAQQNAQGTQSPLGAPGNSPVVAPMPVQPVPAMQLPPPASVELHSQALLKAMIAAAKSDGHLDERETALIEAELARVEADPQTRQWMQEELRRPLDPAEVARAAATPELAAEMYLASLLVADDTSFMERAYLDELARQMQLAPELKSALEAQAKAA
ncbi:MAG: tellurite resistance TerB family protein [Hydrogenophaga sp.]